ncbi:unnamed protein product [Lepeophtheirus salmonis]|uniref:(salmon louse) hypothetical protein n=1 Tax=Lepeophtheirus salmonis TaxID=72036 RepID=A0A7R8CZD3_LEPSM|nr:unnamed protein product [Lepeophtheirus salmonis]CAF2974253.1 unnamed protein product [Lepeophtheirus salmonis]
MRYGLPLQNCYNEEYTHGSYVRVVISLISVSRMYCTIEVDELCWKELSSRSYRFLAVHLRIWFTLGITTMFRHLIRSKMPPASLKEIGFSTTMPVSASFNDFKDDSAIICKENISHLFSSNFHPFKTRIHCILELCNRCVDAVSLFSFLTIVSSSSDIMTSLLPSPITIFPCSITGPCSGLKDTVKTIATFINSIDPSE